MLGATGPPIINPTSINASGFGNLEHVFIIFALIYLGVGLVGLGGLSLRRRARSA